VIINAPVADASQKRAVKIEAMAQVTADAAMENGRHGSRVGSIVKPMQQSEGLPQNVKRVGHYVVVAAWHLSSDITTGVKCSRMARCNFCARILRSSSKKTPSPKVTVAENWRRRSKSRAWGAKVISPHQHTDR